MTSWTPELFFSICLHTVCLGGFRRWICFLPYSHKYGDAERKCWMTLLFFCTYGTLPLTRSLAVDDSWYLHVHKCCRHYCLYTLQISCTTGQLFEFLSNLFWSLRCTFHTFSVFVLLQQPHFQSIKVLFCVKELQQRMRGAEESEFIFPDEAEL